MISLADLACGERGKVLGFQQCDKLCRHNMLVMGLTRGAEVTVLRVAPLGDPMEIAVRGTSLSVRRAEAQYIQVEKVST